MNITVLTSSQTTSFTDWVKIKVCFIFLRISDASPTLLQISAYSRQQSSSHFHTRNLWTSSGNVDPPPSSPLPTSLTVSLLKALALGAAAAAAHSNDRLMNLNGRGFQSLDGAGEKPDAYSVDSPPIGLPAVCVLSLTRLWNTDWLCVCVCPCGLLKY